MKNLEALKKAYEDAGWKVWALECYIRDGVSKDYEKLDMLKAERRAAYEAFDIERNKMMAIY